MGWIKTCLWTGRCLPARALCQEFLVRGEPDRPKNQQISNVFPRNAPTTETLCSVADHTFNMQHMSHHTERTRIKFI
ncbi:hypothetical protein DFH94DRAFT_765442 [Russula ochroleuca]|uniref:Uncharacterized protein n=1 Tax=Russula ochroleuca TaxID=152965 RepID=A0A9P5K137_9AGAM|nr:hypothetical protein DFH94DRAFT_765442 [Russula ochroleuca]